MEMYLKMLKNHTTSVSVAMISCGGYDMDILDIGLLTRHQEKIRLFIFLEFLSQSTKNENKVNLQKVLMVVIESNHKKLVLLVLKMLLNGKIQAVAV